MSEHAPKPAPIRRYDAEVLSRQTACWGGVRAELFQRAATGPSSAEVCRPPHRWQIQPRVENTKAMMLGTRLSLAENARRRATRR